MGALASLCSKHVENRENIAKLIVNRMVNRNALAQTPGGAERVLSAVSKMCNGSSANQAAIAKVRRGVGFACWPCPPLSLAAPVYALCPRCGQLWCGELWVASYGVASYGEL